MKIIFKYLLGSTLSVISLASFANENSSNQTQTTVILRKESNVTSVHRPRMPCQHAVTCTYDGQYIKISFAESEGQCAVYITDVVSGELIQHSFTSPSLYECFYIGSINEAFVKIETEAGNQYVGTIINP